MIAQVDCLDLLLEDVGLVEEKNHGGVVVEPPAVADLSKELHRFDEAILHKEL